MTRAAFIALIVLLVGYASSCVHPPQPVVVPEYGGYPDEVGKILVSKCATAGCHNAASYKNSGQLLLDTWAHLMEGGSSGASVIAYSPNYSPLLYFVNTDSTRGTIARPTMPYSTAANPQQPLSNEEYQTLKNWIAAGAPDKDGNIPFATNAATRQKIYLTNQGCDLVAVIDAQSHLVMRYIPIGERPGSVETPHCIKVAADGAYAYVSFLNGTYVQKIDTRTDEVVNKTNIGSGSWNILFVAPADTALMTSNWQSNGGVVTLNTATMAKNNQMTLLPGSLPDFVYPHGIASNAAFDTFYITLQVGNVVYKLSFNGLFKSVSLDGRPPVVSHPVGQKMPDPHEIMMLPGYGSYAVTCQGTNELRFMDAHTDKPLDSIPMGIFPQEMAMSATKPYIFVTCQEDNSPLPGRKGSVYVVNYLTRQVVKVLHGDFYQPHGVTVDDRNGKVYIASTNANPDGPAPHHATTCGGRAGWYTVYDLNTLEPTNNRRYQVTVDPYSAATRFQRP